MNVAFVIKNKLSKMILFKSYKLRLTNDKLAFDIIYMILIKLIIEDHVKDL